MEYLNGCSHVVIPMCKLYTCCNRMFLFSCRTGIRILLCFHPVFEGDFYMFEIWCFTTVLFWSISIFFLFVRKICFLTHFTPVLPLCRNQPINLNCLLMASFLHNAKTGPKCVKENRTGCLHVTTPALKPYLVSGKSFFSPGTQAWKFSSRFHSTLMGRFLSYISKV